MENLPEIVKPKIDIIFKRIFGEEKNKEIVMRFLSDILEIPRESMKDIHFGNVELTPEYLNLKFSRLDLKIELKDIDDFNDKIINVEMQVNSEPA